MQPGQPSPAQPAWSRGVQDTDYQKLEMEKGCALQFINAKPACTLHVLRSKHAIASWSPQHVLGLTASVHPSTRGRTRTSQVMAQQPSLQLKLQHAAFQDQVGAVAVPTSLFPAPRKHHRYRNSRVQGGSQEKSWGEGLDEEVVI